MSFFPSAQLCAQTKPDTAIPTTPSIEKPANGSGKAASISSKTPDLSKEAEVFDSLKTVIREEADGTGTRQTTARVRILADAGLKDAAVLQLTYSSQNQQMDIAYVRVVKPDGTVVTTPAYNVLDMPADVTRSAPMYSDIHQKHVAVKGLGVGDTLEYQVTLTTLKPEVPGHFWFEYTFQKDLIILDEEVDLDVPTDKTVHVASAENKPTTTTSGKRTLYHWTSSNLARPDPDAPAKSLKHWKPSIQVSTFSSWEQVGAWYDSLQKESLVVSPAVQAKAAALTKGLTSDEDKLHAIFNDVALHIHYVGLEFGIGRYQPHAADDVLSNEYGDCKDKHTLLATELKSVGIEAWPVLISSQRELDPDMPSPSQFNHAITLAKLNGKLVWMDSTEEVSPVGVLMLPLRDKQALVIPVGKPAYLERTPVTLPYSGKATFRADGKLDGTGKFTGHLAFTDDADSALVLRSVFRQIAPSQLKQAVQNFSGGLGYGGEASNPVISDVENIDKPFELSWDYTREKFEEWDDHRISPPLPPTGLATAPGMKMDKPGDDVELGSPGEQIYSSSMELPSGWSLVPPVGVTLSEDWAEYKSTYKIENGVYSAERRVEFKKSKVPLDQWDKLLAFRHSIYSDEVGTSYIFKVSAGSTGFSGTPMDSAESLAARMEAMNEALRPVRDAAGILEANAAPDDESTSKAAAMAQSGLDAIEARTLTLDTGSLRSISWMRALSYAWTEHGLASLKANDLKAAEDYLRAAWQLSQDKHSGYWLGAVLAAKGDKQGAARQFELAHVTSLKSPVVISETAEDAVDEKIVSAYQQLTGHELNATSLNQGAYSGSLKAELDKQIEIHPLLKVTRLNGTAFFTLAVQNGKPKRAKLIEGDKELSSIAAVLESHAMPSMLPIGSKAVLLIEVRVICTQWAGCDADLLAPTAVTHAPIWIKPGDRGKPIELEVEPPVKPSTPHS